MLTQCPNCETTFRVTSEVLRVAQGQVRCGRCQTQFDALQRLIEERAPVPEPVHTFRHPIPPADVAQDSPDIEVEERITGEEITMEGRHIQISGTYRVIDAAQIDGEPQLRQEVTEAWMEVEEEDAAEDGVIAPEDVDGGEDTDNPAQFDQLADSRTLVRRDFPQSSDDGRVHDESGVGAYRRPDRHTDQAAEDDDLSLLNARAPRRPPAVIWRIFAPPLLLILIAQLVHHHRAELARHPQLGDPLMHIYRALNLKLTPDWNLHAYEIKQWGVISDTALPGALKVRASIVNRAAFAQPYPLLKLVLEDRWGDQVRAREFEPVEYLDHGAPADRLFASDQQTNATIVIVDPGPDAEGFRFDVCLRSETGVVCAADVPE